MISNNNNIDNWLQQSAAMGNSPFENADWIAMKQLLEKNRKRRLLIIWLIAAGVIILSVLFLFVLKHTASDPQKNSTSSHNIKNTTAPKTDTLEHIDTVMQKDTESTHNIRRINNNQFQTSNVVIQSTVATNHIPQKSIGAKNNSVIQKASSTNNSNTLQQNGANDFLVDSKPAIKTNKPQKKDNSTNVSTMVNALAANNYADAKTYMPIIKYMHNRYIDSLVNKTIAKDSIVALDSSQKPTKKVSNAQTAKPKKTNKLRSYFELGAGYAAMNIGNELQTGLVKLNYSIAIAKNLYLDIGVKGFLFNNNIQQTHKSTNKTAIPGTVSTKVNFKETTYSISKGFSMEPSIGLHYQFKKIELGAAFNYGSIINKANTINAIGDTIIIYSTLPPNIKLGGGNYDENNFIGKNYSTASLHCSYALNKTWRLQAAYAYLLWYNKVEGVLDDNKKRSSFYFTLGYRF